MLVRASFCVLTQNITGSSVCHAAQSEHLWGARDCSIEDTVVELYIQALESTDGCCFLFPFGAVERQGNAGMLLANHCQKPQKENLP